MYCGYTLSDWSFLMVRKPDNTCVIIKHKEVITLVLAFPFTTDPVLLLRADTEFHLKVFHGFYGL